MSIFKNKDKFLQQYDMKDFNMENMIGKGTFGEVYRIKNKLSNQVYAIKRILTSDNNTSKQIENEILIQFDLPEHPNIAKFQQVFKFDFNSQTAFFIEFNLAESSLAALIKNVNQKVDEQTIIQQMTEAVEGCLFLKRNKIFHRGIKPENFLIEKGHIRLIDATESKAKLDKSGMSSTAALAGNSAYLSPLLFDAFKSNQTQCKHDIEKSDVYSLGLTFLKVCTKSDFAPLQNCKTSKMRQDQIQYLFAKVYPLKIKAILTEMLVHEEQKRAPFEKVLDLLKGKKPQSDYSQYAYSSEQYENEEAKSSQESSEEIFAKVLTYLKNDQLILNFDQLFLKSIYEECKKNPKFSNFIQYDQDKSLNNITNRAQAASELKRSLEGPNPDQNAFYGLALVLVGLCFECGYGFEKNGASAFYFYKRSADLNNGYGQYKLEKCYDTGLGTNKDPNLQFKYAKLSADQNNLYGVNAVGYCYEKGVGTQQNHAMAFKCYKQSADLDNALGCKNLGMCYMDGTGTAKNPNQAFKYLKLSADQGYAGGQNSLGFAYENGIGTQKDLVTAFNYYKLAADQGDAIAQDNLGIFYENGKGTQRNLKMAAQYYKLSADQGNEKGKQNHQRMPK